MKKSTLNWKESCPIMWILGIDTCTETVDVGLLGNETCTHRRSSAPRQQLTVLVPTIKALLDEQNIKVRDVNLIAVTAGPGSFTGIRLGITTVRTLSQVNNIPVVPLNTLDTLARGTSEDGIIIPCMDARKNEIFYSIYEKQGNKLRQVEEYKRVKIEDYFNFINNLDLAKLPLENPDLAKIPPVITGSIFFRFGEMLRKEISREIITTQEEEWTPSGIVIAEMGKELAEQGKNLDYMHLHPNYLRKFDVIKPAPLV